MAEVEQRVRKLESSYPGDADPVADTAGYVRRLLEIVEFDAAIAAGEPPVLWENGPRCVASLSDQAAAYLFGDYIRAVDAGDELPPHLTGWPSPAAYREFHRRCDWPRLCPCRECSPREGGDGRA
jgi:hypothetical protein